MKKHFSKFALGTAAISLLMGLSLQSVSMASGPGTHDFGPGPVLQGAGPWQVNNGADTIARACDNSSATTASCNALVMAQDATNGQSPFGSGLNFGITQINGIGNGNGNGNGNG